MKKVASPIELQAEIRSMLEYVAKGKPSRRVLARRLNRLAAAVEPQVKVAGRAKYYANPYDRSAKGFYFADAKDFDKKWKAARKAGGPEEYEIDFIDGPRELGQLFEAAKVGQGDLKEWDELADEPNWWPAAYYMMAHHGTHDLKKVMQKVEDVRVSEGSVQDYAEELVSSMGGPSGLGKEVQDMYFDMEAYARDMELNGDVREFSFGGKEYTAETQF